MKKSLVCVVSILFVLVLMLGVNVAPVSVFAEGSNGFDFINEAPTEYQEYSAGSGTLTYEPAAGDEPIIITLKDAELYANKNVRYWTNSTYAALAATGDVRLVIEGNNNIYLNPTSSSVGLLFYDSNVTIEGDGNLNIRFKDNKTNFNAVPIDVMGNNDVMNGAEGVFTDSGNITFVGGNTVIDAKGAGGMGAITAHNDIIVKGGNIVTRGDSFGMYSIYKDIVISSGNVSCIHFNYNGLYARRGDIRISGENTVVNIESSPDSSRSMGMMAGDIPSSIVDPEEAGSIYINGGKINVSTSYVGMIAQYQPEKKDSGNIIIDGGELTVNVVGDLEMVAGIYASGKDGGNITVSGGKTSVYAESTNAEAESSGDVSVGIYGDGAFRMTGGDVSVTAKSIGKGQIYALSANKGMEVAGGRAVLKSTYAVSDIAPVFKGLVQANASENFDGENAGIFEADKITTYKYLELSERKAVENVTVSSDKDTLKKGESIKLSAVVEGAGVTDKNVIWSIAGATSKNTVISNDGVLTISEDETASSITVKAISVQDNEVQGSFVITIEKETASVDVEGGALTAGEITGIVLGSLAGVIIIAVIVYIIIKRRKNK